ncbi:histidine phosphatase family protein [Halobellus clavatus]|jgi:broad specificity phosphatase PhoE|uniref:Broad specificity phosphatase PhoE n=1 Tax=Halobellus clavatus TaxID=660517 RepID=A0A1H3DPF8_9EURY|nr:histidine phosphatase family protein [Halobellus clavatus]SDX67539.1 Broad specificity phosphatase PhoE [Halobellus clavatus]
MADAVWVVRHGERRDTVDPDWAEHAERPHDPPLTELGRWAAWRVGRRFAESGPAFDAIYTSPFLRAVETADEICREIGAEAWLEPGLGEHRNAEWFDAEPEILSNQALTARFDPIRDDHEPSLHPTFPETHAEASARVGETATRIVEDEAGTVLLVGHGLTVGGVVEGLVGSTAGVDAPLCGITRIERVAERTGDGTDEWELDCSGDTSHL